MTDTERPDPSAPAEAPPEAPAEVPAETTPAEPAEGSSEGEATEPAPEEPEPALPVEGEPVPPEDPAAPAEPEVPAPTIPTAPTAEEQARPVPVGGDPQPTPATVMTSGPQPQVSESVETEQPTDKPQFVVAVEPLEALLPDAPLVEIDPPSATQKALAVCLSMLAGRRSSLSRDDLSRLVFDPTGCDGQRWLEEFEQIYGPALP